MVSFGFVVLFWPVLIFEQLFASSKVVPPNESKLIGISNSIEDFSLKISSPLN